jgi:hypothetical protein
MQVSQQLSSLSPLPRPLVTPLGLDVSNEFPMDLVDGGRMVEVTTATCLIPLRVGPRCRIIAQAHP